MWSSRILPSQMYFNQLTCLSFQLYRSNYKNVHSYHSLITARLEHQRSNADSIVTQCSSAKRENFNQLNIFIYTLSNVFQSIKHFHIYPLKCISINSHFHVSINSHFFMFQSFHVFMFSIIRSNYKTLTHNRKKINARIRTRL